MMCFRKMTPDVFWTRGTRGSRAGSRGAGIKTRTLIMHKTRALIMHKTRTLIMHILGKPFKGKPNNFTIPNP